MDARESEDFECRENDGVDQGNPRGEFPVQWRCWIVDEKNVGWNLAGFPAATLRSIWHEGRQRISRRGAF